MRMHRNAIRDVVQVRQRTAARRLSGHEIEVFVVALDPVERRARTRILAVFGREVAGTDPERDLGMARHHAIERVEVAMKIADGAEYHRRAGVTASAGTGTSRSFLSQMKSLLLYTASS